jgi:hypothetical protein
MRSFLQQPYPFGRSVPRKLRICAAVGVFVAVFLGLFKPFGLQAFPPGQQWLHALLFGLVTFVVSSACQILLPRIRPRVFSEERWKSWKEIVFLVCILLFIAAANGALVQALYGPPMGSPPFSRVVYFTALVGFFPVVFVVFLKQMLLYRHFAAEALQVKRQTDASKASPANPGQLTAETRVVLCGDGQKERLELAPEDVLFAQSADNYVNVFFRADDAIRNRLLRASLKAIEQQLSEFPQFFRCHRMCVVNLALVESVSGTAQGLRLHLRGADEPIPVSRSLTDAVKKRLSHIPRSPQTG